MDICKINGRVYDVHITDLSESFSILYSSNTGRTISTKAKMTLDPLGTFFSYKITFMRKAGKEKEYDALYEYTYQPRFNGIPVEIVHNQTTLKFDAYISQGGRALKRVDPVTNKVYWDKMTVNIVPMEAQVIP